MAKIEYIEYKNILLTRHEWAQGAKPLTRELDARRREVQKGHAKIVTDFS